MPSVSATQAFANAKANKHRIAPKMQPEGQPFTTIAHAPKWKIGTDARIFTAGSCFAREVENRLRARKVELLSEVPWLPEARFDWRSTHAEHSGYENVYTPGSIHTMVRLALGEIEPDVGLVGEGDTWLDLLLTGLVPGPREEVLALRRAVTDTWARLLQADVAVFTLGYVEAWWHVPTGLWINRVPATGTLRRHEEEFEFSVLGYEDVIGMLAEAFDRIHAAAPSLRMVLTVSPVTLGSTFTPDPLPVANTRSKATLLVAAHKLASERGWIDYFPSYDIVTTIDRRAAYLEDGIHVSPAAVEHVMKTFFGAYYG